MTYYKENGGKKDISQMEQNREVVVVKWSVAYHHRQQYEFEFRWTDFNVKRPKINKKRPGLAHFLQK